MAKATERTLMIATASFWAMHPDGTPYVVQDGRTLLWSDHPAVGENPHYFKPVIATYETPGHVEGRIEQATAAPGEKRGA
jgi:hypothetical protein